MFAHINWDQIFEAYRDYGIVLAILLPFIEAFLPFLPLTAFVVFNIAVFGFTGGVVLSWVGSTLGCWAVYWVVRSFHNHKWMKKITSTTQYNQMQQKFDKYGGLFTGVLFFLPIFPNSIMTVIAAVNKMDFKIFALSSSVGIAGLFLAIGYGTANLTAIFTSPLKLATITMIGVICYTFSKRFAKA